MKNSKKLLAVILSAIMVCAMVISMAACDSGNEGGGSGTPEEKVAAAKTAWDSATGDKSATDKFEVSLIIPAGGFQVEAVVKADMTRKYKGSDISEISGKVTSVEVKGLDKIMGTISGFVNLNEIIKETGKDEDGKYYITNKGNLYVVVDEEEGKETYELENGKSYKTLDAAAEDGVTFSYIPLLNDSNNISFKDSKGLVSGTVKVVKKEISASYAMNMLGMAESGTANVPSDVVTMDTITGLLKDFKVDLDLDSMVVYDITKGTGTAADGSSITTTIKFETATSDMIKQLDKLYADFMDGKMDDQLVDVVNGFAEEEIDMDKYEEIVNPIRGLIDAFISALFEDETQLSKILAHVLSFKDSKVTIATDGDKISKISGTQEAYLTVDGDFVDNVIDAIDEQKLINDGDMKGYKPEGFPMAIGALISTAKGMLIDEDTGVCKITVKVKYETSLKY